MRKKFLLFAFCILNFVNPSQASYLIGMHISYEYTGNGNDYIFRLKLYRDCDGPAAPLSMQVTFNSVSCGQNFTTFLPQISSFDLPPNLCAGFGATTCVGGNWYGVQEYLYEGTVTVPSCTDWIASASVCCRHHDITNLVNPDFYAMRVETSFDNLNFPGNSSPTLSAVPFDTYCAGTPSVRDYSAVDMDGDSLHYELVPAHDASNQAITMVSGYTFNQPLASFTGSYLDSLNGLLFFNPSQPQISSLAVQISEYRNGILISKIRVEDQVVVKSQIASPDIIAGRVFFDLNSNAVFDTGDQPVPNVILQLYSNMLTTTDSNGEYEFNVINGTYSISIPNPPLYTAATPASISINTSGGTYFGNKNFILAYTQNIDDLEIHLNSSIFPIAGQNCALSVVYENSGTQQQVNVEVTLTLDALLQYVSATPAPTTVTGNSLTWNIASIPAYGSGTIQIQTTVSPTATLGTGVFNCANITPVINDYVPLNNEDCVYGSIAASYDPNFKEVTPAGNLGLPFIAAQDWLTYTIHFQNLGTAPAQIVRISDVLDPGLELATLEYINSSFPCTTMLSTPNHLEFTFNGINLPPASVDEPGSHGFVTYRIRPKSTLIVGDYITNCAGIYFDFNAPVYTNVIRNDVVTSVGILENESNQDEISIYPNPATEQILLEINNTESRKSKIEVFNYMGVLVKTFSPHLSQGINRITISVEDLAAGNYYVSVTGPNGRQNAQFSVLKL